MADELGKLERDYREKLRTLRSLGIDPYPHTYRRTNKIAEIKEKYGTDAVYRVGGRVTGLRYMGKMAFFDVRDETEKIQVAFRKDALGEKYDILRFIDRGDIIGVEGPLFKTKAGELTIDVKDWKLLCKSLVPPPDKWHGVKDPEIIYGKRHLFWSANPQERDVIKKRAKAIKSMRDFLDKEGFIEVETPILQPVYGGAVAAPFKTHCNAKDMDMFLQISPELYLKRFLIGDFEKVYTITKNFRNEDMDTTHNPEFTMMEAYAAYDDYNDVMDRTERMVAYISQEVLGTTKIKYRDKDIDLTPPWTRITMYDAIKKYSGVDVVRLNDEELKSLLEERNLQLDGGFNRGLAIEKIFDSCAEPNLIQPTFVTDYPKETIPLCKPHRKDPALIERFEGFINAMEIANAYTELNDAQLQEENFKEQEERRKAGDKEAHPMDMDFVEALKSGMPPTGGLGVGVDRLIMLLLNKESIRDIIPFPMTKPVTKL